MTVLVFNTKALTCAAEAWVATELRDAPKPWVQIHTLGARLDSVSLPITLTEFLALLAEGGKIVDVRHLQEPK